MKQNNIRNTNERKRNFNKELSLFNPLYLQFYFLINEIKNYFENLPQKNLKLLILVVALNHMKFLLLIKIILELI